MWVKIRPAPLTRGPVHRDYRLLKGHPVALKCAQTPENQGGGGSTVVELND